MDNGYYCLHNVLVNNLSIRWVPYKTNNYFSLQSCTKPRKREGGELRKSNIFYSLWIVHKLMGNFCYGLLYGVWTGLTMFHLPDSNYFNPMDYLMAHIVVALRARSIIELNV